MLSRLLRRQFTSSCRLHTPYNAIKLPLTIKQLLASSQAENSKHTVTGYLKSIRRQKNVSFAVLTDGSTPKGLQAVFAGRNSGEMTKELSTGAAVRLTGTLSASPGPGQERELVVSQDGLEYLGGGGETYPLQKKAHVSEYLRDWVHLRARTDAGAAVLRLRQSLQKEITAFFDSHEFVHVNTPVLTANDAEGAGESFKLAPVPLRSPESGTAEDFFTPPASLTVSAQLHLEAMAQALGRAWTLSPCFRAERSATRRHLAEFWMLEAEWALSQEHNKVEEIMSFVESLVHHTVNETIQRSSVDILALNLSEERMASLSAFTNGSAQWPRISYTDAISLLQTAKAHFAFPPTWGAALQTEHEKWLCEEHVGGPVFVYDYPRACKSFYMLVNPPSSSPNASDQERETVACFDLLVPGALELAGGSVREHRLDVLDQSSVDRDDDRMEWYRDLRRFGGLQTGGFGIGFERLVSWVGGVENVRECVPVPRTAGRILM